MPNRRIAIIVLAVVVVGGGGALLRNPIRSWYHSNYGRPAPSKGHLWGPEGLAVDSEGGIYAADQRRGNITLFDRTGKFITQFDHVENYINGDKEPAPISRGLYLAVIEPRHLVFVAAHNVAEVEIQPDLKPKLINIIGSRGHEPGQMDGPEGISRDTNGDLYVTDEHNRRINVFDKTGKFLRFFRVPQDPQCVTVWRDRVYVSLNKRNYLACYTKDGVEQFRIGTEAVFPYIVWGMSLSAVAALAVLAALKKGRWAILVPAALLALGTLGCIADFIYHHQPGQFRLPEHVCVSPDERSLFISDRWNCRIQVFDMDGHFIRCFGERGTGPGQFREPKQMAFTPDGRLLVSDRENNRIQIFTPSGAPIGAIE
jgi:sugar lactone lactonase YvrE